MLTYSSVTVKEVRQVTTLTSGDPNPVYNCLKENGAVRVRANASFEQFEALSDGLITPMVHHSTSMTVERDPVNAAATTSTVNKGMDSIPLHREGSYAPGCPDALMLYCVRPSDADGETTLCDGVSLLESLPVPVRAFVENAVLNWSWTVPPERWMTTLGVTSKEDAIARLKLVRARLPAWEHLETDFDGDILHGTFQTLCAIPTRWGNKKSFCNSLLIYHYRTMSEYYPKNIYTPALGDGSPFPPDVLSEVAEYAKTKTFDVHWQEKDILLIDNSRYMHGRKAFTDVNRRILVRMGHVRGNGHDQNN